MIASRIHFLGPSGAGVSTLGRAVAERLHLKFFDTDDFLWVPTVPPYRKLCTVRERQRLLGSELGRAKTWVLSGSLCGWGDIFVPLFDMAVLILAPQPVRIARLREREEKRFGAAPLEPGGELYEQHEAYIAWAGAYDHGGPEVRSRRLHDDWIRRLPPTCRVLQVDGTRPVDELVDLVAAQAAA